MREETKVIKFESISRNDKANYTCEVANAAGQNEFTYEIVVRYSPQIRQHGNESASNNEFSAHNVTEVEATADNVFKVDCLVDAYPEPQVIFHPITLLPDRHNTVCGLNDRFHLL